MPPVEIAAPPPSPAPEIVAAQLNKAPLCLPPTSCPGWIAPCLHSLTVAEALRLERTSRRWRAWLLSADHIWQQLAASSGVSLRCAGPLSQFFRVASWRRVCVELVGALSRDLRGEDAFLDDAAPGCMVEVFETVSPDRDYTVPAAGEVFEPSSTFRPSDVGVPVRLRDNQRAWAIKYRVLKPHSSRWWRAVCDVDVDDAAARDFCAGLAGRHWVAEPGGVFTFCASRTVTSRVEINGVLKSDVHTRRRRRRTTATRRRSGAGPRTGSTGRPSRSSCRAACGGARARSPRATARSAASSRGGRRRRTRGGSRRRRAPWRTTRRRSGGATTTAAPAARTGRSGRTRTAACSRSRTRACRSSTPPSRRRGASSTRSPTSSRATRAGGYGKKMGRGASAWGLRRTSSTTTKGIFMKD